MLYTQFPSPFLLPSQSCHLSHKSHTHRSPIKVTRIATSHALLALSRRLLLLLWRLVRLIRLITALRRRCLLLLLRWRRRMVLRHRWLLRRVHARRALKRHALHLRTQVGPLLLLLLLLLLLRRNVRVIPAYSSGHGDRVSVVDWRLVAAGA